MISSKPISPPMQDPRLVLQKGARVNAGSCQVKAYKGDALQLIRDYSPVDPLLRKPLCMMHVNDVTPGIGNAEGMRHFVREIQTLLEYGRLDLAETLAGAMKSVANPIDGPYGETPLKKEIKALREEFPFLDCLMSQRVPRLELLYRIFALTARTPENLEYYAPLWLPLLSDVLNERSSLPPAIDRMLSHNSNYGRVKERLYFISLIPVFFNMTSDQARLFYLCLDKHHWNWTKSGFVGEDYIDQCLHTMKQLYSEQESDVLAMEILDRDFEKGIADLGVASCSASLQVVSSFLESGNLSEAVTLFIEASRQAFYAGGGSDLHPDLMALMNKLVSALEKEKKLHLLKYLFEEVLFNCFDRGREFSIPVVMRMVRQTHGVDKMHTMLRAVLNRLTPAHAKASRDDYDKAAWLVRQYPGARLDEKSLEIFAQDPNFGEYSREVLAEERQEQKIAAAREAFRTIKGKLVNDQELSPSDQVLIGKLLDAIAEKTHRNRDGMLMFHVTRPEDSIRCMRESEREVTPVFQNHREDRYSPAGSYSESSPAPENTEQLIELFFDSGKKAFCAAFIRMFGEMTREQQLQQLALLIQKAPNGWNSLLRTFGSLIEKSVGFETLVTEHKAGKEPEPTIEGKTKARSRPRKYQRKPVVRPYPDPQRVYDLRRR